MHRGFLHISADYPLLFEPQGGRFLFPLQSLIWMVHIFTPWWPTQDPLANQHQAVGKYWLNQTGWRFIILHSFIVSSLQIIRSVGDSNILGTYRKWSSHSCIKNDFIKTPLSSLPHRQLFRTSHKSFLYPHPTMPGYQGNSCAQFLQIFKTTPPLVVGYNTRVSKTLQYHGLVITESWDHIHNTDVQPLHTLQTLDGGHESIN